MKKFLYSFVSLAVLFVFSCSESGVLKEAAPGSAKVSSERLLRIDQMIQQAVDSGWTAGASAFIARDGKIVAYNERQPIPGIRVGGPVIGRLP